jgi:[protein-PII] uridylyltransferase
MTTSPLITGGLRDLYTEESARIQREFDSRGDGRAALAQRTALVENIALRLWKEMITPQEGDLKSFSLVALGGLGRGWLFPYSDIDLLFLYANRDRRNLQRQSPSFFSGTLGPAGHGRKVVTTQ